MAVGRHRSQAVVALNRFGFGARGDMNVAAGDLRAFLLEELHTANIALIRDDTLPSGSKALQAFYLDQQAKRVERAKMLSPAEKSIAAFEAKPEAAKPDPPKPPSVEQALYRAEAGARLHKQLQAPAGFVERLVAFWSKSFRGVRRQERHPSRPRRPVRTRGNPALRAGQVLGAPARGSVSSGDDPLSRQSALHRAQRSGRDLRRQGVERESRPRDSRVAHARRRLRFYAGGRERTCAGAYRLERRGGGK